MTDSKDPILPGTTVTVNNQDSIYNGYEGFVPVSYTHLTLPTTPYV